MKTHSDVIQSDMLTGGSHYYSCGDRLREKHRLAGDKFVKWSLDRIPNWTAARILDAGGGWGRYVWTLLNEYSVSSYDIVLTDISTGMLRTAKKEAKDRHKKILLAANSIESLPFPENCFDIVMANKVLYHLGDIERGIAELARVMKPGGKLLATTNSDEITALVIELHYQALEELGVPYAPEPPSPFSMENGEELLAAHFGRINVHYFEDEIHFLCAAALREVYENIGRYHNLLNRSDISNAVKRALPAVVEQLAEDRLDRDGVLPSPVRMGSFVCENPRWIQLECGSICNP